MSGRKSSSDEPTVSLDSLMDALTNVVAVLILVLILLQADVGNTVQKLLADLPPATPEQLDQAKATLAGLERDRAAAKATLSAKPPEPKQIAGMKAQLALLEKSLKESEVRLLDIAKLRELYAKHQAELDTERRKTDALIAEIRRLESLLDTTPIPRPKKPDIVRIPNSREIPEGANVYYAYVFRDRVHLIDPVTAKNMVVNEFEKVRSKMLRQTIKVTGGRDRKVYDQDKLVKHFATLDLKVRGQRITVPYNRQGTRLNVRIEFDLKAGGVTLADMEKPNSEWHRLSNLVRSFPRSVLIFRVHPNGFAAYLRAREIADQYRVPCGWEITGNVSHTEPISDFEVNRLEQPKPQPKPTAPRPPAPKRGLD